nr:L-rhamnose mutarotase [Halocatena marina]
MESSPVDGANCVPSPDPIEIAKKYREEHKNVPDRLERTYLDSDADLETYSVFEKDGHVFGFMELEGPGVIEDIIESSGSQADWDQVMANILEEEEDIWME